MDETKCSHTKVEEESFRKPNLLERLRQQPYVMLERLCQQPYPFIANTEIRISDFISVHPETEEEENEKMNMIIKHRSEFPTKIQEAIREASEVDGTEYSPEFPLDATTFLQEIEGAITDYIFGRPMWLDAEDDGSSLEWYGLNHHDDTEEEIELSIRLFPCILDDVLEASPRNNILKIDGAYPIFWLSTSAKAVFFVPLFAELGTELGCFERSERGGLCGVPNVLEELLSNSYARTVFHKENVLELEKESLAVLGRIQEKGLVTKDDINVHSLLETFFHSESTYGRSITESRLRFMIDWDPTVLLDLEIEFNLESIPNFSDFMNPVDYWIPGSNLLYNYSTLDEGFDVRIFELIFELGMEWYPQKLGFLFHRNTFRVACRKIGHTKFAELVHKYIAGAKGRSDKVALRALVVEAAVNPFIVPDGVYFLLRSNPMAILPESPLRK